jgi:hypothetical protein
MDDGHNDASAGLDGQYATLDDEIDAVLIRAERMRDQSTQMRDRSKQLRQQAGLACKAAQALIDRFAPLRRQGSQQIPDRHPIVDSPPAAADLMSASSPPDRQLKAFFDNSVSYSPHPSGSVVKRIEG